MFREFEKQVEEVLKSALDEIGVAGEVAFREPPKGLGDLSTSLPFNLASELKKSPDTIAKEIASRIKIPRGSLIARVVDVKGYLNFYLDYGRFTPALLDKVMEEDEEYGRDKRKEKVILEHTSANPNGPLHIGHIRNAIIGDTLARILRFNGSNVETQFYVNDMGRQLATVAWGAERFESDKKKSDHAVAEVYFNAHKAIEENPRYADEVSALIDRYEKGEKEIAAKFKDIIDSCLSGIKETLAALGIEHDKIVWEGDFVRNGSVSKVLSALEKSGYLREDEVLYLDLKDFGIEKEMILKRRDGTSLYATRDLAYHLWKLKRGRVINVWGADHKLAAEQLRAALKLLGGEGVEFIIYEFISLPEGSMSTRRGVYVSADDLIEESVKRAYAEVEKRRPGEGEQFKKRIAKSVGIAAIRFNVIRVSPEKAMVFKWEEALDFERQGAPFLQYAYARACRILEKGRLKKVSEIPALTENEVELVKTISKFPLRVEEVAEGLKPALIASYVLELADVFHRFYKFEQVLESETEAFRLNLVNATRITMRNALNLLGIEAPEAM